MADRRRAIFRTPLKARVALLARQARRALTSFGTKLFNRATLLSNSTEHENLLTLSRRDALKYTVSAAALAGLGKVAASATLPKASADGQKMTQASVKDYGATGDGTTDDTAAIHAARDAVGVEGKLIIPSGIYLVSGCNANVANQQWLLSTGAVLKMKTGANNAVDITAPGVTVAGGVFDGANATETTGNQICLRVGADGVTIRDASVQNSPAYGIGAYNCNQLTISGCTITNTAFDAIFVQNTLPAPSNIYDISITNNVVDNSSSGTSANVKVGGIYVRGESTTRRVNRVTISRNTVRLPYNPLYETCGIQFFNGTDYVVANNIVSGGFLGITCPGPRRATFAGNQVRGFSYVGIELPGTSNDVVVRGNLIDPIGVAGITAGKKVGTSGGQVTATGGQAGIQTSIGTITNLIVAGNSITNFPAGPAWLISFNSGTILNGATVSGNTLTSRVSLGEFNAIRCTGTITNLAVTGNIIDGGSAADSWGIVFHNTTTGVSISGNQFSNLARSAVKLAASGIEKTIDQIYLTRNVLRNCGEAVEKSTSRGATLGPNISSDAAPR